MMKKKIIIWCGVLTVLGALAFLVISKVAAVGPPTVDSVIASATPGGSESALTLAEYTTTTLYVRGSASDPDGCSTIASVSGRFYRTDVGGTCSFDNNTCYNIPACTLTNCSGGGDLTLDYACTAQIQFYADSTMNGPSAGSDWTANIKATDSVGGKGTGTDAIEMNTTVALGLPGGASVSFGSVGLGQISPQRNLSIINSGNSGIDFDARADGALNCQPPYGGQSIALNALKYSLVNGFAYAAGTSMTTGDVEVEMSLAPRTNDAAEQQQALYFLIQLPASGVGGHCQNNLTFTAKADAEGGW